MNDLIDKCIVYFVLIIAIFALNNKRFKIINLIQFIKNNQYHTHIHTTNKSPTNQSIHNHQFSTFPNVSLF